MQSESRTAIHEREDTKSEKFNLRCWNKWVDLAINHPWLILQPAFRVKYCFKTNVKKKKKITKELQSGNFFIRPEKNIPRHEFHPYHLSAHSHWTN